MGQIILHLITLQITHRAGMLKSRSLLKQAGYRQNQLRRISKNILWVNVSSEQLTKQNPHQELSGSEDSVLLST